MDTIRKYKFTTTIDVDFLALYSDIKTALLEDYPEYVGNISDENEEYKSNMRDYAVDGLYGDLVCGDINNTFFDRATGTTNNPYYTKENKDIILDIAEDFEEWLDENGINAIEKELVLRAPSDFLTTVSTSVSNNYNQLAEISW